MSGNVRFPGEYEPHIGTLMIWPERPGSWGKDKSGAEKAFADVISNILKVENMYLIVSPGKKEYVFDKISAVSGDTDRLYIIEAETDDAWARDTGPTFVVKEGKNRVAVNWTFNAWGGEYDGLYAEWDRDNAVAKMFANYLGDEVRDSEPFVLEGGSIHTDGEGTLMVTESCLLSPGRNPDLSKKEIENTLKKFLGIEKVLWLPRGIYMDETNEHVDNVCAFIRPGEVVLAWTDNEDDPQYELSKADLDYLESITDAKGRRIKVHKLPIPDMPVCCTKEDIDNYVFEPGEDEREVGERLAASYVNFYFANGRALVPQFGGENKASDERAVNILKKLLPEKEIVPIYARNILLGGGNIHCITQQIPAV
jgi:agmatine deiminase